MDSKNFALQSPVVPEDYRMSRMDLSSKIAENQQMFGQCDIDTAAKVINNEEKLEFPATYYMFNTYDTNPDGSIKQAELKKFLEQENLSGVVSTLADSRLYAIYNPLRQEAIEKEHEYGQAIFDESSFINKFKNDFISSAYSKERSRLIYDRAEAEQKGDDASVAEYDYKIKELDEKLSHYFSDDGVISSSANVLSSIARNPELIALGVAAGVIEAASGGTATPMIVGGLSAMAEGTIIFKDTYKIEAGEMLERLEREKPSLSTEKRLEVSQDYAFWSALIEASTSLFRPVGMGFRAATKGARRVAGDVLTSAAKKERLNAIKRAGKEELLKRLTQKSMVEAAKDPKKLAFIGKKVYEHAMGALGEGGQEVSQQMLQDAFISALDKVNDPKYSDLIDKALDNLADGSKASEYAKLFVNTALGSLLVSGTGATVSESASYSYNKMIAKSASIDVDKISQKIIETKAKSEVYKKSPKAYNEQTQILKKVGSAPEEVIFSDVPALRKVREEAEATGNADMIKRLDEAGITEESLKQAEQTTGDLKVDFAKFDEQILDPDNQELFQKVKGLYTFDETTLTKKEMETLLSEAIESRPELRSAISDTDSVFNAVMAGLSKNKNFTPNQVINNAIGAQLQANRIMEFEGKSPEEAKKVSLEIINTKESLLDKAKGLFDKIKEKSVQKELKDTKAVDKQGNILILYHGTDQKNIKAFDREKSLSATDAIGTWFGESTNIAEQRIKDKKGKGVVYSANLSLKNPLQVKTRDDLNWEISKRIGNLSNKKEIIDKLEMDFSRYPRDYGFTRQEFDEYKKGTASSDIEQKINIEILDKFDVLFSKQLKPLIRNSLKDYDGVIIEDDMGYGKSFVAFSSEQIHNINIFKEIGDNQQQSGHIAGVFSRDAKANIIKLTEAANPTTFMHEFNHLFMTEALDSYNSGNMTEYWQKQINKVAKFVGAEPVDGKLTFNTEQMEKVADAFTTYLKEGKAPIESLSDFFARMAEWFIDVYKKLKMSDVRLNKSIREAFDAMLVSAEEVDNALIDKRVQAIGRRKGVSEDQYQKYLSDLAALKHQSTIKHIEAIRKKARTELEKQYQDKKNEIREQVIAELAQDRQYQLRADIRNLKIFSGDIPAGVRLRNRELFVAENGIPAEQFLTDYSDVVSNVGDLVDLLNSLKAPSSVVEERTNEQFEEWLLNENPELAEVDARVATANKNLIRARVKEYLMLKGIPLERYEEFYNNLIRATDEEMATMPISYFMNTDKLMDLETKIVTKARFAKNDNELADILWHQAAVNYMMGRAKDIKGSVLKFKKHFDKYKRAPKDSALKRIDAMDFDMIAAILYNFRFTGRKPRMRDIPLGVRIDSWINNKLSNRFSDAEIVREYSGFLTEEKDISRFERLSYEDFNRLRQTIGLIEGISQGDKVKIETDKRELREADAIETAMFMAENDINPSLFSWWTDNVVMKESLLEKVLPQRIFTGYVLPFVNAITMREQRIEKNDKILGEALADVAKRKNEIVRLDLLGGPINLTYEELQVAVLNADNMETWIASYNRQKGADLTKDDYIDIVSQAPEEMWSAARKIWDLFDSQKAEFREAQYRTNGFLMDMVDPRKITLRDGTVIQTGYYPRSAKATAKEFDALIQSSLNNSGINMGTASNAKDRTVAMHSNLDLSINSLKPWLYHTATVIEVGQHYNALNSLLKEDSVRLAMGENASKMFSDWMSYSIVGDHVNKLYSALDQLSSVQILGWDPLKFIVQSLGFIPAMGTVGIQWVAPQFLKANTYGDMFNLSKIRELSPYMNERYGNAQQYIANITDDYRFIKVGKSLKEKLMNFAMYFTIKGDAFASAIVWHGAHDKAIAQGLSENEAVLLADSAVRTTQGDSTSVSRPKVIQGNQRFLTKFASYFIAQNSKITSALVGKQYMEAVTDLALAGIISPVIEAVIKALFEWNNADDDKKRKWRKKGIDTFEDFALDSSKKNIWTTLGTLTMPVAGIGSMAGSYVAYGQRYKSELPMLTYAGAVMDSVRYSALLMQAETPKEKQKAKKELVKSTAQVLTIPKKYANMLITD